MLHLTEFVIASIAIILLPGPGQLAILTATLSGGRNAGLRAVAGLVTGDICIMTLTGLGVATVLGLHPEIQDWIRWGGGAYICWIGLRTATSRLDSLTAVTVSGRTPNWYLRTVGITLLNPKAILFFVSFFPLFKDPSMGTAESFLRMGTAFSLMSGGYLVFFTWMGSRMSARLQRSETAMVWVPRVLGTVIVVFGGRTLAG